MSLDRFSQDITHLLGELRVSVQASVAANSSPSYKAALMVELHPDHVQDTYQPEVERALVVQTASNKSRLDTVETRLIGLDSSIKDLATSMSEYRPPPSMSPEDGQAMGQHLEQRLDAVEQRLEQRLDTVKDGFEQRLDTVKDTVVQKLDQAVTDLKAASASATPARQTYQKGPEDEPSVMDALADTASISNAIKMYGPVWLMKVKRHWPLAASTDAEVRKIWEDSEASRLGTSYPPTNPALLAESERLGGAYPPNLLLDANLNAFANALGSTASLPAASIEAGRAPSDIAPSIPTTPSVVSSLPFAAALVAGRHIKFEFNKPDRFSKMYADFDISAYLGRLEEYFTLTGVEPAAWGAIAATFLTSTPLKLWDAHKMQAAAEGKTADLYAWGPFKAWFTKTFAVRDLAKTAFSKLLEFRQNGSVADYKAQFDVLAAQAKVAMHLRMPMWEKGLKPDIREKVAIDPNTHIEYTDIDKAQQAALQIDLMTSDRARANAVSNRKRSYPEASYAGPSTAAIRPFTPSRPQQQRGMPVHHYVSWSMDKGSFKCPNAGTFRENNVSNFVMDWVAKLDKNDRGEPRLPADMLKDAKERQSQQGEQRCFVAGCQEKHRWQWCAKLANMVRGQVKHK